VLECHLVLADVPRGQGIAVLDKVLTAPHLEIIAFDKGMLDAARRAFDRFGKGKGHPAKLNICDCMSYAVARHHDVPLLYKGGDFARTDIRSALP
jgi:ribonuclease VapC